MKFVRVILMKIACAFILFSCYSSKKNINTNSEVIDLIFRQFEPNAKDTLTPFWNYSERIWYKDSMAIEEVRTINMKTSSSDNTLTDYPIKNYRFSDLRKNTAYEYLSFSDTALLIRKFSYNDTSIRVTGGWNFVHNRRFKNVGQFEKLSDTVINKIQYTRLKNVYTWYEVPYSTIYLLRCDKKNSFFSLVNSMHEASGCPIVKIYQKPNGNIGFHYVSEINFITNTFSVEVEKIFDTWKNYAEANPVK